MGTPVLPGVHSRSVIGHFTPLHIAAARKGPREVRELLAAGADVNARDNAGWTPLHHAANFNKNQEVIIILLDKGADPHALDNIGGTPRYYLQKFNRSIWYSKAYYRLKRLTAAKY